MLVRHDAEVRVVITCSEPEHDKPCNESILKPAMLDAHLALASYEHGKISGMMSPGKVQYKVSLVKPERDILKNGQLCPCGEC